MKTFNQFIAEADAYTKVTDGSSYGGGMSSSDIDSRTDLTPAQKAKLKARRTTVPGSSVRGGQQAAAAPASPNRGPGGGSAGGGGNPPRGPGGGGGGGNPPRGPGGGGPIVPSSGGKLTRFVGNTAKDAAGGAAQGVATGALRNTSTKVPGLKSGAALSAALSTADEKSKGSGWLRSLAKGATVAAGTALGGLAGGAAGTAIAPGAGTAIGGYAGQAAGAAAADKAFDVAAGANAAQRKAMATANRTRQAGGALKGIGGKTTFDTKKNTMTTGSGSQKKTVQLGKTSVVTGPGGKQETGYLAYKGGKAVYKRAADPSSLARTSSNPLERIGRSLFSGAYKQSDAAAAAKKLAAARQSDVSRQKALGVKMKPGG